MGLDVHILPIENVITIDKIKKDSNLIIEEGEMTYIKLAECPESKIGLYSYDEDSDYDIDFARVWSKSPRVLKYIAETYDALIGADGFLNDAGYCAKMESGFCDSEEEVQALYIGHIAGEMLEYDSIYEWSYKFKMRLENAIEEVRETYNNVVEKIKAGFAEEHKRYLEENAEDYVPYEVTYTGTTSCGETYTGTLKL